MEIVRLRSFLALAEYRSFSKAARALSVTQSTISLHVQALEAELQVRLVERQPRQSVLTPEGEMLLETASQLVRAHDRTVETFQERHKKGAGRVRVAASNSIMMYYLPSRLQDFLARWPQVDVTVLPARRDQMVTMLAAHECDFAISDTVLSANFHEILRADVMLIMAKDHPLSRLKKSRVTLEDVARYPLVVAPPGSATRHLLEKAFEVRGLQMRIALATGGAEMIKRYAEVGLGLGFVSRLSLRAEDLARLHVVNLHRFLPQRRYGVVLPRGELSLPAKRFLRLVAPGSY